MSELQDYWDIFVQGHTAAFTEGPFTELKSGPSKDVTTHPYGEENT